MCFHTRARCNIATNAFQGCGLEGNGERDRPGRGLWRPAKHISALI